MTRPLQCKILAAETATPEAAVVAVVAAVVAVTKEVNLNSGREKIREHTHKVFTLQWHLTDRCDQRCRHCYIYNADIEDYKPAGSEREFGVEDCYKTLEKFRIFCERISHKPHLALTGGDPLLYPYFWPLAERAREKGINFSILGNPFRLDPSVCRKLKQLGCSGYQLSLDGFEETHDKFRKPGSFQDTLKALELLRDAKVASVVMSTVSKENYRDIPGVAELVAKREVFAYAFARYCPVKGDVENNMTPQEYKSFLETMLEVYERLSKISPTKLKFKDHLWTLLLHEKSKIKLAFGGTKIRGGCGCGRKHLTLLSDGTIYACRRFKSPVGSILKTDFRSAFFGPEMKSYRSLEIEKCADCELLYHCRGCRAVSYGSSGSYFNKDPQCWKIAK